MILGSRICSMTSCSVRPKPPTSKPKKARTMEATRPTGMLTGPTLREVSARARMRRARTEAPTARRAATPDWR